MKDCPCWLACWDQSFLLTASAAYELSTQKTRKHQTHTRQLLRDDKHGLRWAITGHLQCFFKPTCKQAHGPTLKRTHVTAPSTDCVQAMIATDDSKVEGRNLLLVKMPDDTNTRGCSVASTAVVSSGQSPIKKKKKKKRNHMMDEIQLQMGGKKTTEHLNHKKKKINKQGLKGTGKRQEDSATNL